MASVLLTGIGLAAPAGLNAYLPLLIVALAGRFSDLIVLERPYDFIASGWGIAIIVFLLTIELVVDKHVGELRQLVANRKIAIELTPAARAWLAEKGFDKAFGARPMARLIEKTIKKPLSELLLFGEVKDGDRVVVDVSGDGLQVRQS